MLRHISNKTDDPQFYEIAITFRRKENLLEQIRNIFIDTMQHSQYNTLN